MDPNLVKGHFFLGQALQELDTYDESIKHLQRGKRIFHFLFWWLKKYIFNSKKIEDNTDRIIFLASDLAKEQKLNFGDDIASQLRAAKKKRFSIQEEKRIAQEIDLHSYLNKLLEKDKEQQINNVIQDEGDNDTTRAKIQDIEEKCVGKIYLI